jgi:MYXO-CTERM domain-containing protein
MWPSRFIGRNESMTGKLAARLVIMRWVAVVVLLSPSGASAYERAHVPGSPETFLYWSYRQIHYSVNRAGAGDVPIEETLGAVRRAFFSWASPSCTDVYFIYDGLTVSKSTNISLAGSEPDFDNLIVWHDVWPPSGADEVDPDLLVLTTVVYSPTTGEIIDADIDLNGQKYWTTSDDSAVAVNDVQAVLTHEIGYLLGLNDSDEREAVMFAEPKEGDLTKRVLAKDDIDGLCQVYPFSEETPTGPTQPKPKSDVEGGCTTAGSTSHRWWPLALLALAALWRRRRRS